MVHFFANRFRLGKVAPQPTTRTVLTLVLCTVGLIEIGSSEVRAQAPDASGPASVNHQDDPLRKTAIVDVVRLAGPAVVNISADGVVQTEIESQDDDGKKHFRHELATRALGTGVIIDPFYVVTNNHVVEGAARVRIALADRREYVCDVVGTVPELDLAVLKVQTDSPLPIVEFGDSTDIYVGETTIAIGNPFGLGHTVTTGVVSALHRSLPTEKGTYHDFLQTDASINPGNSGGALLNLRGKLIGINTAVHGRAQGIGFAIPSSRVERIVRELIAQGEVRTGYFGIDIGPLSSKRASEASMLRREGVYVTEVARGGPAAKGGVLVGDVIFELEGFPILSLADFGTKARDFPPGSKVKAKVWRDKRAQNVEFQTEDIPANFAVRMMENQLGISLAAVDKGKAKRLALGGKDFLQIKGVREKSLADKAGLEAGDVLRKVADLDVRSDKQLLVSVLRGRRQGNMDVVIDRGGRRRVVRFILMSTVTSR
ncbi:MAG: PDZ domain-containing protein [Deltaproteobacteria bacterium]|nr:PDZ domain-containing protein [Deltaproteobacteria bacterium]